MSDSGPGAQRPRPDEDWRREAGLTEGADFEGSQSGPPIRRDKPARPVPPTPTPGAPPTAAPLPTEAWVRPGGLIHVDLDAPIPVPHDVRIVGSDLDGTLLAASQRVGWRALAAIPELARVGIELVYVTGRPPRWLHPVIDQTGYRRMAVCANGALVVDIAEERLVRSTPIHEAAAQAVVARLRELVPGVAFALERLLDGAEDSRDLRSITTVGFEPAYDPPWAGLPGVESGDVMDLIARGRPVKLLAAPPPGTGHDSDSLLALAESEFAGTLHITHSGTREVLIEIMSGEIDKGIGFLEVAELLGIEASASIAVGDMPNDVALIRAAATGYAVANAHPWARAAANHIVPSNEDDGVGRLLEAVLATHA